MVRELGLIRVGTHLEIEFGDAVPGNLIHVLVLLGQGQVVGMAGALVELLCGEAAKVNQSDQIGHVVGFLLLWSEYRCLLVAPARAARANPMTAPCQWSVR